MPYFSSTLLPLSILGVLLLASCTAEADQEPAAEVQAKEDEETVVVYDSPSIVATTSVLGDVATQIATCVAEEDGATSNHVRTLLPIGTDPHDFEPSSEQVAAMMTADIVVANGLMLEEGLLGVFDQVTAEGGNLWETAEWVDPLEFAGKDHDGHEDHGHEDETTDEDSHAHGDFDPHDDHGHEDEATDEAADEDSHAHGDFDPHYWLDMSRMASVAAELGTRLGDIAGDEAWQECGDEVSASILAAEQDVITTLDAIPSERRVLMTDHDAFSYLADRYGFEIAGVVIPGGSTLAEATSQDIARLVTDVTDRGVLALIGSVYKENTLLDTIAAESGGEVSVVPLYVESVGEPGGDAATYQQMMIWNAQRIAEALQD